MTDETPTQPPTWQQPGDAKAAAKAAQAYAKASRPWYKKKRFFLGLPLVAIVGISAATGAGSDDASDPPTSASQPAGDDDAAVSEETPQEAPEEEATKPAPVADNSSTGKGAITWGNWEVVGKIQVSQDALNQYDVITRVTNIGDSVDTGFFTVTILKGQTILGTADCTTSDVNPGAVATAECFSLDDYVPDWTEITIEDAF